MKNMKRTLAFTLALATVFAVAGCGSDDESSAPYVDQVEVVDTNMVEAIPDGAEKEIIWMGTYDLNPGEGEETSVEMSLFEKKGGTVKYSRVIDSEKFDKLATAVMSNKDLPDIFKYEWMAFPSQVLKNMYQPVDSIVDFTSPLWSDVAATADQYVMNDNHYVAPISFSVGTLMMYDNKVIKSEGLDDPYEEYLDGNWNWDTWKEIMEDYVSNGTAENPRYGINGWFQTQLIQQTGKTMINYDGNSTFTSNINDPDIERAETFLYNLGKEGLVFDDWTGNAKSCIAKGNILFYCMGPWALTGKNGPSEGDEWSVVPVPSDPDSEEKYMTSDMTAYMWVAGSTKTEAVKCWFECARVAQFDESYKQAAKDKFMIANPNWTDEMYQVYIDSSSSEYKQVFDYGYGISPLLSDDNSNEDGSCITRKLYEYTNKTNEDGTQYTWTSLKESYSSTIDSELDTINKSIANFKG